MQTIAVAIYNKPNLNFTHASITDDAGIRDTVAAMMKHDKERVPVCIYLLVEDDFEIFQKLCGDITNAFADLIFYHERADNAVWEICTEFLSAKMFRCINQERILEAIK